MRKTKIYINNIPYTKKGLWFYCPEKVNEPSIIAKVILESTMEVSIYTNNFEFIKELKNILLKYVNIKCEYYINNDRTTFRNICRYFKKEKIKC